MLKDMIETYKRMPPVENLDREIFLTSYVVLNITLKCDVTTSCPIPRKHLLYVDFSAEDINVKLRG